MNRETYEHNKHCLRKLLHKFNEEDEFQRAIEYCFGLQYYTRLNRFHLWDAIEQKTLATIKLTDENVIVRLDPKSMWTSELEKIHVDDMDTILVEATENLQRHNDWLRSRVHSRCERAIREREDFLERQRQASSPNILHIPISTTTAYSSPMGQTQYVEVQVQFGHAPSAQERQIAVESVRQLVRAGSSIARGATLTMDELIMYHRDMQRQTATINPRRATANMFYSQYYEPAQSSYMGRPIEQLQEYLERSGVNSLVTETDFQTAARALDEQNVPREYTIPSIEDLYIEPNTAFGTIATTVDPRADSTIRRQSDV